MMISLFPFLTSVPSQYKLHHCDKWNSRDCKPSSLLPEEARSQSRRCPWFVLLHFFLQKCHSILFSELPVKLPSLKSCAHAVDRAGACAIHQTIWRGKVPGFSVLVISGKVYQVNGHWLKWKCQHLLGSVPYNTFQKPQVEGHICCRVPSHCVKDINQSGGKS